MRALPLFLIAGCSAATPAAGDAPSPSASTIPIPNAIQVDDDLLVGGRPTPAHIEAAHQQGYSTVIDLRTPGEPGVAAQAKQVRALGMNYVHIPMAGASDLTEDNARKLRAALDLEGPALLHCASGNRVGALLALEKHLLAGQSAADALAYGKRTGLTGLEPAVRARLGL